MIGIARNARYRAIDESGLPHVYLPTRPDFGHALLVKTVREPRRMLQEVQDLLDGVGPGVAGFFPRTHGDHLAIQLLPTRVASAAAAWFGGFALVLCAIGLYGLVSWFVTLRHAEMAVRLALGATRRDVERLVLRQAFATAIPGLIGGMLLSAGGAVLARGLCTASARWTPSAVLGGLLTLMVVVAGGQLVAGPSRRADRSGLARSERV